MKKTMASTGKPRTKMMRSKKMAMTSKKRKKVVKREKGMTTKRAMMRKMMKKRRAVIVMKMIMTKSLLKTAGKSIILRKLTIFWMNQRRLKQIRSQNKQRKRIRK